MPEAIVGLLDRFEQRMDRMVNGAFAKAFKSDVQPVEIAAALQREIDDRAAIVSRGRTVVPNVFSVALAESDYERLGVYADPLRTELAEMAREYAEEQRYSFLGPVDVQLKLDDGLETGLFRVKSEAKAGPMPKAPGSAAPTTGGGTQQRPRIVANGRDYPLKSGVTKLGRGTEVDIRVDDPGVSRHHADIVVGASAVIRDLNSTNGTYVDGVQISEAQLKDGAAIRMGSTSMVFRSKS